MKLVGTLSQCAQSFANMNMYIGQRLWWSGAVALLTLVGAWIYVVPQVYFDSRDPTLRDWLVAAILVPVSLTFLLMVFGRVRRAFAAPIAKPKFLTATRAGQRFHDRMIGGVWFFNIVGIPIAATAVYYAIQIIVS